MAEVKPLILYDRSRVVTDWKCPRARYYGYEYGGKGLISGGLHLELYLGSALHDGLAAIAQGVDIDAIASAAFEQVYKGICAQRECYDEHTDSWAREQGALTEGLLRGFYKHTWPRLLDAYPKVIAVEQEMIYRHDEMGEADPEGQFSFMAKPDLIMEDREGNLIYVEYKSTSSTKEAWINSWQTAVQLHSTCRAVEATLGRPVVNVVVQGLYKGYVAYNKQNSPFCYAYYKQGNPPFSESTYSYNYAAGFKKVPAWLMDGGVKAWVAGMPEEMLAEQFPQTPPIFIREEMIDAWFRQRALRETEIEVAARAQREQEFVKDMSFPQRFDQCNPGYGKPCQFVKICHGHVEDPLEAGFQWREPHHQPEVEKWNAQ